MPGGRLTDGEAPTDVDLSEDDSDSESDDGYDLLSPKTHDPYVIHWPAVLRTTLQPSNRAAARPILDRSMTGLSDECYLPTWVRGVQGFQLLCRSTSRFQHLAQLKKSAETGQVANPSLMLLSVEKTNESSQNESHVQELHKQ
jgi:hypothetical protein